MAIKYKMEERMRSMAQSRGGDFANGTKPVLRYSELRGGGYGVDSRGGIYDEIQFLRNDVLPDNEGTVDTKLSDIRIRRTVNDYDPDPVSNRYDQAKRELFEKGNTR